MVSFRVGFAEIARWSDAEGSETVEPGLFLLHAGPRLDASRAVELRVR